MRIYLWRALRINFFNERTEDGERKSDDRQLTKDAGRNTHDARRIRRPVKMENWIIPLCLMLIEQPDISAIRAKTRYDRSSLRPSQASLNAIGHPDSANEASVPANKNYNYTL